MTISPEALDLGFPGGELITDGVTYEYAVDLENGLHVVLVQVEHASKPLLLQVFTSSADSRFFERELIYKLVDTPFEALALVFNAIATYEGNCNGKA